MKIKSKLLAGGLMTAVACGLVGSITGTFAWYQVSNRSTVSMHGKSVGVSKNLEVKIGNADWKTGNLTWNDIAAQIGGELVTDTTNYKPFELKPLSNGANADGLSNLNTRANGQNTETAWWGNPEGGEFLPEAATADKGFIQFKFSVRYVEVSGQTTSYPAADLYITDIGANLTAIAASNPNISNALRVHVDFGDSQCLFNPFKETEEEITLEATLDASKDTSVYDWETPSAQKYQLPQDQGKYTAADEAQDSTHVAGSYKQTAGKLFSLAHSDVLQSLKSDGSLDTDDDKVTATTPANNQNGLEITVTAWLEGFAAENTTSNTTNWWTASTTVGSDLQFGFQLSGFKA